MTTRAAPAGVYCAAATPFNADFSPDLPRFAEHCRRLLAAGCDGIALLGTTGEANSFSVAERQQLLDTALAAGIAPGQLMPGTGACAAADTVALTKHALDNGVTRVVMLPPFYYKGVSDDGLFAAYARTIDAIGDARLDIILYHIPQMSAVPLSFGLIGRLRDAYPDIVVGIKDSSGDFDNMKGMVETFPGFSVFAGADPLMLPMLRLGGAGCITAVANLIAADLALVYRNWTDPAKEAEIAAAQERITAMRVLANRFPQIPSVKSLLAHRTGHDGWRLLRPPLMPLEESQRRELGEALDAMAG